MVIGSWPNLEILHICGPSIEYFFDPMRFTTEEEEYKSLSGRSATGLGLDSLDAGTCEQAEKWYVLRLQSVSALAAGS